MAQLRISVKTTPRCNNFLGRLVSHEEAKEEHGSDAVEEEEDLVVGSRLFLASCPASRRRRSPWRRAG